MSNNVKKSDLNTRIMPTVMAIREILMEYYKGVDFDRVMSHRELEIIRDVDQVGSGRYWRLRLRDAEEHDRSTLYLKGVPILTMERRPELVSFFMPTMGRSVELQAIRSQLELAVKRYLFNVGVTEREEEPDDFEDREESEEDEEENDDADD